MVGVTVNERSSSREGSVAGRAATGNPRQGKVSEVTIQARLNGQSRVITLDNRLHPILSQWDMRSYI
jgi:hypothetical protein